MISDSARLAELIQRLGESSRIALDTEADSLHCYFEKLCLIQISTETENFLVDPLSGVPLQPLFDFLSDRRIVFHGADYDLRLLRRAGSFEVDGIFDTMIAARLCGLAELGLAALVEKFAGVKLSKASQKANWAIRPLSEQMLEYAVSDTRYLLQIAAILEKQLEDLGRLDWFAESRDRMVASTREVRERDENKVWRINGSAALSPRAQAVLRVLWFWRDSEARAWDRPPFHVMGNEDLVRVADKVIHGEPYSTPRMSGRRRRSFEVVLALAMQIPENEWPKVERGRRRRPSKEQVNRFEFLKKNRDAVAASLCLDPAIIAPRGALDATSIDPKSNALMNWQKNLIEKAANVKIAEL